MTRQTDTDWIAEGAEVAEYTGNVMNTYVRLNTIAKVTKTQIVLADGKRYNRERLRPVGSTSYRDPELCSVRDQRVLDVLAGQQLGEVRHVVDRLTRNGGVTGTAAVLAALEEIEAAVASARQAITANAQAVAEES